jgi:hypothetical protein
VGEDELLEGIDLVLERHKIRDGFVAFIRVVDRFKTDVLFIFESSCSQSASCAGIAAAYRTVELWVLSVEGKLGHEIVDVFGNQRRIASHALAGRRAARQALKPAGVRLCLFESDGMAFLEDLVDGNERLECLDFIGEDWLTVVAVSAMGVSDAMMEEVCPLELDLHFHALPERGRALVVPCVDDACSHMFPCRMVSRQRVVLG